MDPEEFDYVYQIRVQQIRRFLRHPQLLPQWLRDFREWLREDDAKIRANR